jgi:uncharacterized protein YkwD
MNLIAESAAVIIAIAMLLSAAGQDAQKPPAAQNTEPQTVVFGPQTPPSTPAPASIDQSEAMLGLVNDLRGSVGAGNLALDPTLCEAADIRAREIAQSFSHTRPNGTSCFTVFDDVGSGTAIYRTWGENIAAGSGTGYLSANEPFLSWKNSSGHYANMTNGNFTIIGIGSYNDGKMTYWVQLFAAKK